jgi:hypothetical protein
MTTVLMPICMECARRKKDEYGFKCEAYPGGIPFAIIESSVDHRKPYKGDHGLQFIPEYPDKVGEYTRNPLLTGEWDAKEAKG